MIEVHLMDIIWHGHSCFELVSGERRLRAARMAGLSEVPCLLADVDEESSGMLALVENLQRRDLDYIEEAEGLQKLMQQYHLSQEQAARRIGKSQSAVANKLRILRHPPSVLQALRENHLTERHARALLKLPDEAERLRVIGLIAQGEWTVAKTEQYIDSLLAPRTPQRRELGGFVLRDVRLFLNSIDHQLDLDDYSDYPRIPREQVTARLLQDLDDDLLDYLPVQWNPGTYGTTRIGRVAAYALKARIALNWGLWEEEIGRAHV